MPGSFGVREIIPVMPGFLARHPSLNVSLLMSDQRQDTIKEGVDVALRLGELADSSATARLIGRTQRRGRGVAGLSEGAGARPGRPRT